MGRDKVEFIHVVNVFGHGETICINDYNTVKEFFDDMKSKFNVNSDIVKLIFNGKELVSTNSTDIEFNEAKEFMHNNVIRNQEKYHIVYSKKITNENSKDTMIEKIINFIKNMFSSIVNAVTFLSNKDVNIAPQKPQTKAEDSVQGNTKSNEKTPRFVEALTERRANSERDLSISK